MKAHESEFDGSEVAICGMAARFPGAPDIGTFWENLKQGVESISRFTEEEILAAGEDPEVAADRHYVRARPVIDGVELFDAGFFGFTPREAEVLDPQARVLLECAWEALERAGYDTQRFKGSVALFAGASFSTYLAHHLYKNRPVMRAFGDVESTMFNIGGTISTMVSYKLNLKGVGCSVQTFCSTSLVAVHLACQSLLSFESDMALAGGVSVITPQARGYVFREGGIVSPDGCCRPFDADASGTVFGSGAGIVALRRLKDALADGDPILAIIRGSAANNDGSLKASYTAPSVVGQTEVIVEALGASGVHPETIGYLEAQGTATKLGDPAEVEASTKAFRTQTKREQFCAIGSVKGNVGHLEAAAGIVGLIKVVLCLQHKQIPPSINYQSPNPLIDFARTPFYVNTALTEWPRGRAPLRAAVSAFGVGGTNVHVVLQEAPDAAAPAPSRSHQLLVFSAKSATALDDICRNIAAHLASAPVDLADVAYTLQVGRRELNFRRMIVADTADAAVAALAGTAGPIETVKTDRRNPPIVFVFPGQSAATVNMGRELYESEGVFREHVDRGAEAAARYLGADPRTALYPASSAPGTFDRHDVARASLFIVEHALAQLWMSWGIRPESLVGDGVGEHAAACVAGVFSVEDGLKLLLRAGEARLSAPRLPYVSSQTGATVTTGEATNAFEWSQRLADGDQWHSALKALEQDPRRLLLAVGPVAAIDGRIIASIGAPTAALSALGRLWQAGVNVDWAVLHGGAKRRRVALPTYPFERQRYWVDPIDDEAPEAALVKTPDPDRWLYAPVWQHAAQGVGVRATEPRRHLVFADRGGIAHQLSEELRKRRHHVMTVVAGDGFGGNPESGYAIDPRRRSDYHALLTDLRTRQLLPEIIVHAWSVDPLPASHGRAARFDDACDRGFYSLLYLAEAIGQYAGSSSIDLKIISSEVQDVLGDEPLSPEKAPMLGLCRVISQEHQTLRCWTIDIERPAAGAHLSSSVLVRLTADVLAQPDDTTIAYRHGRRWARKFQPIRVEGERLVSSRVRPGGTYLVIGGLGHVGFHIAASLFLGVRAKLVLTGRAELPPHAAWDAWLDQHVVDDETSARITKLLALEKAGAEVLYVAADAASAEGVRSAVVQARDRFGTLDGVVHAAGVVSAEAFQPIARLDRETCERHFSAKVHGLNALDEVLGDAPLDFCLLVSSLSSVLGGLGYGAYAAANVFMDTFATSRNRTAGTPWISVNWDQWQFGDATASGPPPNSGLAALAMTPAEGSEVLERVLRPGDVRQFVVSTANLDQRMAGWVTRDPVPRPTASSAAATQHARPVDLSTEYEAPATETERTVARVWEQILGIDRVGVRDNFFELGGNSLTAIQVVSRLYDALNVRLSVGAVFETGTVADLAEQLDATRWAVEHQQSDDWAVADHEEIEI